MITPSQIKEKKLTVSDKGYNIDETNQFVAQITESYEAVFEENKELYRKMEILAAKIEEYRADEDYIKTALITAQKMADQITREAKEKAESSLSDSAASAQETVMNAKEKAEKLVSEARDYAASITKEKTKAAEEIIAEAEHKANEAIGGAKVVAQNVIAQAKEISAELVSKAKSEKAFHENLVSKLKAESDQFKTSLVSLYEVQLNRLKEAVEFAPDADAESDDIKSVEEEMKAIVSEMDELQKSIPCASDQDDAEKTDEAEKNSEDDSAETEADYAGGDESVEAELRQAAPEENEPRQPVREEETESVSEQEIESAVDAFGSDEITPLPQDGNNTYVAEITEEAEMEEEPSADETLPFENYFNVKREDVRTDEVISLIPPDDYDEDEDDNPRFKGFFKKKK